MLQPPNLENLNRAQRERLAYIDFRLYFMGEIGRPELTSRFGVAPSGATRDLALYREIVPHNIEFDGNHKIYRISKTFVPLFNHTHQRVLSALSLGFGDGPNNDAQPMLACEVPSPISNPPMEVLAPICRALHAKRAVAIRYHSLKDDELERVIVPFALIDSGLGWHVRAFDRKTREFRNFVITRIAEPIILDDGPKIGERPEDDIQWTRIVEIELVPHPDKPKPEITLRDYGFNSDTLVLKLRAATVGYTLKKWGVDCSPDHHLSSPEYRLWLKDHLAIYGVKNALLAPGYVVPEKITSSTQSDQSLGLE